MTSLITPHTCGCIHPSILDVSCQRDVSTSKETALLDCKLQLIIVISSTLLLFTFETVVCGAQNRIDKYILHYVVRRASRVYQTFDIPYKRHHHHQAKSITHLIKSRSDKLRICWFIVAVVLVFVWFYS